VTLWCKFKVRNGIQAVRIEINEMRNSSLSTIDGESAEEVVVAFDRVTSYIDRLEDMLEHGNVSHESFGDSTLDRGYKSLLTLLKDVGCRFPNPSLTSSSNIISPDDKNICLSLMDIANKTSVSKTKDLNILSNYVSRAILYGGKAEKDFLAEMIEESLPAFAKRWLKDDRSMNSQEIVYMKALSLLLKEGISKAEGAVTYRGDDTNRPKIGNLIVLLFYT